MILKMGKRDKSIRLYLAFFEAMKFLNQEALQMT